MIIIFLGPPGAGKGTQGKKVAEKGQLHHISVGDIFRDIIQSTTQESNIINNYVKQGKLIPDEIVNKIVKDFLLSNNHYDNYIIDGYPRNLLQAKFFESIISSQLKIIYFDISDEFLIKRIIGRYSCNKCGTIYNSYFTKTKVNNICDVCGSSDFNFRKDDNEEIIKKRIEEYQLETYPLIDFYKNHKYFYRIDGSKKEIEIENDLEKILKIN